MAIIEQGGQAYQVNDTVEEIRAKLRPLLESGRFLPEPDGAPVFAAEFTLAGPATASAGSLFVTATGSVIVVDDKRPGRGVGF